MFYALFWLLWISIVTAVMVTQVIRPLMLNRPLFPWFRTQSILEGKITELNQRDVEQALQDEIKQRTEEKNA